MKLGIRSNDTLSLSIPSPGGASLPLFAENLPDRMLPYMPLSVLLPGVIHPAPVRSTLATVRIQKRKRKKEIHSPASVAYVI